MPYLLSNSAASGNSKPHWLMSAAHTDAWDRSHSQRDQLENSGYGNARPTARTARSAHSRCVASSIPPFKTVCTRRWISRVLAAGYRRSREYFRISAIAPLSANASDATGAFLFGHFLNFDASSDSACGLLQGCE